jgi:transcriptional regulator with AAA-type ATPase domain
MEGARRLGDRSRFVFASSDLARCCFWQGRYPEAFDLASTAEKIAAAADAHDAGAPMSSAVRVRTLGLQARAAAGRGELALAGRLSTSAMELATGQPEAGPLYDAAYAGSWAALCDGDYHRVGRLVELARAAARRTHNPLGALRARLLEAEAERRGMRVALARRLVRRTVRATQAGDRACGLPLPAIIAIRCQLLADLLGAADAERAVERHVDASGLRALALLVPCGADPTVGPRAIDDVAALVEAAQRSCAQREALGSLCAALRDRLAALYVGVHAVQPPYAGLVAAGGRLDPDAAGRVIESGCSIAPRERAGCLEGVVPVRVEGRTVGLLVTRFSRGAPPAADRWSALSLVAAGLAGTFAGSRLVPLQPEVVEPGGCGGLIGASPAFAATRRAIAGAASVAFPVLIEGESGTGKELVARAIHAQSPRREQPLRALNCAALPDELVDSELFGLVRGAFTGAVADRPGVFEDANGGTLFLDEVGELTLRAQAKLLRTIQESEIRRVGETRPRRIDVRLIAATNRDLRREVDAGRFRLDLWYRLNVLHVAVPPLRERRDDIAALALHVWMRAAAQAGSRAVLSDAVLALFERYDWPGNVRELENVLAALAVRAPRRGVVQPALLPAPMMAAVPRAPVAPGPEAERHGTLADARRRFDVSFIAASLGRHRGCRSRTARELGVTRQGLAKLIQRLGLVHPGVEPDSNGPGVVWPPGTAE